MKPRTESADTLNLHSFSNPSVDFLPPKSRPWYRRKGLKIIIVVLTLLLAGLAVFLSLFLSSSSQTQNNEATSGFADSTVTRTGPSLTATDTADEADDDYSTRTTLSLLYTDVTAVSKTTALVKTPRSPTKTVTSKTVVLSTASSSSTTTTSNAVSASASPNSPLSSRSSTPIVIGSTKSISTTTTIATSPSNTRTTTTSISTASTVIPSTSQAYLSSTISATSTITAQSTSTVIAVATATVISTVITVTSSVDTTSAATSSPLPTPINLPTFGIPGKLLYAFAVGTNLSLPSYEQQLGHQPAMKHEFFKINKNGFEQSKAPNLFVTGVNAVWPNAFVLLTLEPWVGLDALTNATYQNISNACVGWNKKGIRMLLRFAHEMNADWYPWGNVPEKYTAAWQTFSTILRQTLAANNIAGGMTTMVWCPNVYYKGLPYSYADFYPGDEHIDWVALDIYGPPDVVASSTDFISKVTSTLDQNFYDVYCVQKGKPMMIPETSSSTPLGLDPGQELIQKRSWWSQLYSADLIFNYPMLRVICWFEVTKNGRSYGVFANSTILATFLGDLPDGLMVYSG